MVWVLLEVKCGVGVTGGEVGCCLRLSMVWYGCYLR